MDTDHGADLLNLTARIARVVQTTVGWIFWDPGAVARYADLGLPEAFAGPLGYIASRSAPLAGAGPEAISAAFGSISQLGIAVTFEILGGSERFVDFWAARDEAVLEGLRSYVPEIEETLVRAEADLWMVVDQLPRVGRVFFGAVLNMARPDDPLLRGWHALNAHRQDPPRSRRRSGRSRQQPLLGSSHSSATAQRSRPSPPLEMLRSSRGSR